MPERSVTTTSDNATSGDERVWTWSQWVLTVGALLAFLCVLVLGAEIGRTRCALTTPHAPRAMVSLQLARSTDDAVAIAEEWRDTGPDVQKCEYFSSQPRAETARRNLALDSLLIVAYVVTLVLAMLAVLPPVTAKRRLVISVVVAAIAAGLCDFAENAEIARVLAVDVPTDLESRAPHVVGWLRLFAQVKFVLLLAVVLCILTALLARVRRWWLSLSSKPHRRGVFFELAVAEANGIIAQRGRAELPGQSADERALLRAPTPKPVRDSGITDEIVEETASAQDGARLTVSPASSDEPWISFRSHDLVGLALSGGEHLQRHLQPRAPERIEQAQDAAAHRLPRDGLGGGYIGSFWTAWLKNQPYCWRHGERRRPNPRSGLRATASRPARCVTCVSSAAFLAARRGFFEAEMWEAIVTVLAGFVVSFVSASSLIGLALVVWLGANFFLACPEPWAAIVTVLVLSLIVTRVFLKAGPSAARPTRQISWRASESTGASRCSRSCFRSLTEYLLPSSAAALDLVLA